jgi:hypothetical protein
MFLGYFYPINTALQPHWMFYILHALVCRPVTSLTHSALLTLFYRPVTSLTHAAHRLSSAVESSAASLHQLTDSVSFIAASVRSLMAGQQAAADAEALLEQREVVGGAAKLGLTVQLLVLVYMGLAYGKLWEMHQVRG